MAKLFELSVFLECWRAWHDHNPVLLSQPNFPQQLDAALAAVQEFATRPEGWAGPGSVPVSAHVIEGAKVLLRSLPEGCIPLCGPSADGEIVFTWLAHPVNEGQACNLVSAGLESDGWLSWAFRENGHVLKGGSVKLV